MKKIVGIMLLLAASVFSAFAQSNADSIAENMVLPDGETASIALYKKWGPANTDITAAQPKDKKPMVGTGMTKAKTESDIGYFKKKYKETENASVEAICKAMKDSETKYGVAWVDHGNRVTRCVFTYKSGSLNYDRMDFFDETNESYAEFLAKENAKKEKLDKFIQEEIEMAERSTEKRK